MSAVETARTYTGFIAKSLDYLYMVSVQSPTNLYEALKNFMLFLPTEVKKQVKPKMQMLTRQLQAIRSYDHYDTRQKRLDYAIYHSRNLLDETIQLLDERGYLERKPVQPRAKGHGRLRVA